jgi:hypothetical protein
VITPRVSLIGLARTARFTFSAGHSRVLSELILTMRSCGCSLLAAGPCGITVSIHGKSSGPGLRLDETENPNAECSTSSR